MSKGEPWTEGALRILTDGAAAHLGGLPDHHLVRGQIYVPDYGLIPILIPRIQVIALLETTPENHRVFEEQKAALREQRKRR